MCHQTNFHCPSSSCLSPHWSSQILCASSPCNSQSQSPPKKRRCDNCTSFKEYLEDLLRAEKEREFYVEWKMKAMEEERKARERARDLEVEVGRWNREFRKRRKVSAEVRKIGERDQDREEVKGEKVEGEENEEEEGEKACEI
ncbi:hypothetical protein BZA77DRAFT_360387 [Pyronema omphalodes]|nr:hypothetical protein BZA77DRAFT_360387 [Pyronema omphalodes]